MSVSTLCLIVRAYTCNKDQIYILDCSQAVFVWASSLEVGEVEGSTEGSEEGSAEECFSRVRPCRVSLDILGRDQDEEIVVGLWDVFADGAVAQGLVDDACHVM